MGKYTPLGDYLRKQSASEVPMTFAEIEEVINGKLPPSSRYRAWWSNNSFNSVLTKVWLDAGFESKQVDMEGRKLVFRRIAGARSDERARRSGARPRSGRHPLIGAMKGTVWIAPGVDLTEPADPHWGEVAYGDKTWEDFK
jgi:hypothetical protein